MKWYQEISIEFWKFTICLYLQPSDWEVFFDWTPPIYHFSIVFFLFCLLPIGA